MLRDTWNSSERNERNEAPRVFVHFPVGGVRKRILDNHEKTWAQTTETNTTHNLRGT